MRIAKYLARVVRDKPRITIPVTQSWNSAAFSLLLRKMRRMAPPSEIIVIFCNLPVTSRIWRSSLW